LLGVRVQDGVFLEGKDSAFFVGWLSDDHEPPPGETRTGVHPGRGGIIPQIREDGALG
jgi:hypothetical protein